MTHAQAHKTFAGLQEAIASRYPVVRGVKLVICRKHFLSRPKARDLAWYDLDTRTIHLVERALAGPDGRVAGLLAHELGHAADPVPDAPYAERRADAMARKATGIAIRYDKDDVQNLKRGVTPRPSRLPENLPKGSPMKRNPKKGYKMPEAQARHTAEGLLARMKADGADTFAKKVAWVKRHMPNIDRPRTFVGWVTKGERGRVVLKRNPLAGPYPKKVDWDAADSFEAHIVLDDGQVVTAGKRKHSTVDSALNAINGVLSGQIAVYRVKMIEILAYRGNDYLGSQQWVQEASKRNPTPAYHRSRGEAELMLAGDSLRKAGALRKRGDASGSHDALIHAHRMAALAEADLLDGASPRAAEAKRLAWWKAYSALAADKKRNPRKSRPPRSR